MQLKVDVESGKLIIKKSKDGSEDKFYSHKKSKTHTPPPRCPACSQCVSALAGVGGKQQVARKAGPARRLPPLGRGPTSPHPLL